MNAFHFPAKIIGTCALLGIAPLLHAGSDTNSSRASIATHIATHAILKTKAQMEAVVESSEMESVKLAPRSWADLTVVEAVAHGSRVKKGDLLIKLDLDKLRDQIEDLETDRPLSAVSIELADAELKNLKEGTPNKLESARRAQRVAAEEYSYFEKIGRAAREKNAKFNVKSSEQRLENANEELRQLEKMYKADDLTEETEEIVLKRQKFVVESAQFYLQTSRESTERDLGTLIPREEETLRNARRDQELALTLAEQTLPKTLSKKQLDFEKLKRDQRKSDRKLTDLRYDLDLLAPRASSDGIIYYGACENGKWTTGPVVGKRLVPGGKLMPNEILMTLVNPDRLRLRAVVPESDLATYTSGMKGEATPVSAPAEKLGVKLDAISMVPMPGGGFDATLTLARDKGARLFPGMNCKVAFANVEKRVTLAVPKQAVFTDATQKIVYVQKADGTSERRTVKTGDSDEVMIEITEGISEGDKVLLKKPETKPEVKVEV